MENTIEVYLEVAEKRALAAAIDWPGWARFGKDETAALQALIEYGPRYERVVRRASLTFHAPASVSVFKVVETLPGSPDTAFGSMGKPPRRDSAPVDEVDLKGFEKLLRSCWSEFDAIARSADGKVLSTGPRGGGRNLEKIKMHVLGADQAYLRRLGSAFKTDPEVDSAAGMKQVRHEIPKALRAAAAGAYPALGPRGGKRWSVRYYVRRSAWHVLDHAWEIEDRVL